MDRWTG